MSPVSGIGAPALVLGSVLPDERAADERASDIAERLGREELAIGLHDRERREVVPTVEGEPREDLPAEVRRADAVPGEPVAVMDAGAAAEDRQVRGGDVDRTAPGMRDLLSAQLREEANEAPARALDHTRVELQPARPLAGEAHRSSAPAEGDAAVACGPHVVNESAAVDDGLATGPAELLEDVRDGLGEDDVTRGHCERQPIAGEARSRGVDREHGCASPHAALARLDAPVVVESGRQGPFMDPDAAFEKPTPQPEREPGRLHRRVEAVRRAAEEDG